MIEKSELEYLLEALNDVTPGDRVQIMVIRRAIERRKQDLAKADAALLYTNREKLYMDTPQNVPNTADNTPKGGDADTTCVCTEPYWKQWKDGTTYCTRCGWRQGRTSFTNKEMSDAIAKTSMECLAYDPTPKPNVLRDANHCVDCCCARSWKALGVTEYTGKSIPEHIDALLAERDALSAHDSQCIKDRVAYCEEIEELEAMVERLTAERDAARAELREALDLLRKNVQLGMTPLICAPTLHDDVSNFLDRVGKQP